MSFKSHNHKGNSRRRERHEDQEQLSGATFKGHKKHGVTKSHGETDGYYDFESTTLDTVSEDEDSIQSRRKGKSLSILGLSMNGWVTVLFSYMKY